MLLNINHEDAHNDDDDGGDDDGADDDDEGDDDKQIDDSVWSVQKGRVKAVTKVSATSASIKGPRGRFLQKHFRF